MESNSSVTVVIVNWNSGDLLQKCCSSLADQTLPPEEIVVVDNNSSDDSLGDALKFPNVRIIRLDENVGFARANNIAIATIATKYVALVNPDAFPEKNWLESLVFAANEHPDYKSFACLQLSEQDPNVIDGLGDCYHFSGLVWRRGYGQRLSGEVNNNSMKISEVFSACGGAAFYHTSVFKEVGGFDASFFCYCEDIDLGFRLRLAGHPCLFVPEAIVRHVGSAITSRVRGFATYHGHRNMLWTFFKNMPTPLLILFAPAHLFVTILCFLISLRRGEASYFLKSKLDGVRQLPQLMPVRRKILARRSVSLRHLVLAFTFSLRRII